MIDLQTIIDEINTGKIEFDYKDDDCCTTEGEVVILLKRLAELEKADYVEVVRCKDCKHKQELDKYEKRFYIEGCVACTQISPNSDRLVMLPNDFCSWGERRDT